MGGTPVVACRLLTVALLLGTVPAVGVLLPARSAVAATTFTVNTTGDGGDGCDQPPLGDCTLREAIAAANDHPGADTIAFAIPGAGPHTIEPSTELPTVTDRLTIDGYTQGAATADTADDATENTLARGSNAILKIELNGAGADGVNGLVVAAANSTVKGLAINRFLRGIRVEGSGATGVTIAGNFVGTDPAGTLDRGNTADGLILLAANTTVGGAAPAARNVIAGNGADGISIGPGARGSRVQGNQFGTTADGTAMLPNGEDGVVVARGSVGNRILANSSSGSGSLGINLRGSTEDPNGVTANDPRDRDTGANNLQNAPVLASATTAGAGTTITGTLDSRPGKAFTIQFFANPATSRHEGATFLGQKQVATGEDGQVAFAFRRSGADQVAVGRFVTATATNDAAGDTSEFSAPRRVNGLDERAIGD